MVDASSSRPSHQVSLDHSYRVVSKSSDLQLAVSGFTSQIDLFVICFNNMLPLCVSTAQNPHPLAIDVLKKCWYELLLCFFPSSAFIPLVGQEVSLFIWGFTSLSTLYRSYHRRVVGRAEETSTYSSLGFCTVNCRPTASNYQLSHLRP